MASLAGLLKEQGYKITGSDQNVYPPMSTQLEELGIKIMQGYKKENLHPRPDLVIVGNVISKTHEEAAALLESDIPYTSLPKAMGEFVIQDRHSLVVAGTHGKTTTTSMLIKVADACGVQPSFMVGGIPVDYGRSFAFHARASHHASVETQNSLSQQNNGYFIIEGDEYDTAFFDKVPKFIHYKPRSVILTSIEFDHADIYKDLEAVMSAFRMLIERIPADGLLIANGQDKNVRKLISEARCRVVTYGTQGDLDYRIVDREIISGRNHFVVERRDARIADVAIKLPGEHNAMNALAVFALAQELKWGLSQTLQGLASFQGVKRRQEVIGTPKGITLIEDFAHHPTAVKVTVQAIKEKYGTGSRASSGNLHGTATQTTKITSDVGGSSESSTAGRRSADGAELRTAGRLICLFEPRSATSRRKIFQKDYVESFALADFVFIAQAYDQTKISSDDRFSTAELVQDLNSQGKNAKECPNVEELISEVKNIVRPGDVVLIMSNGGFGGIYKKLQDQLA